MPFDHAAGRLREVLSPGQVSTARTDRVSYSGDLWPKLQVDKLAGKLAETQPDCIVWPSSTEDVAAILRVCHELAVPIVPYGAGSGVCGGTVPVRGGVVVDLRKMDRIHLVDATSLVVDAEVGIIGHHLERVLDEQGMTLGHFPSSILCSTLGGWVAARSAGQCSSRYGKIEDMVLGLEVVVPGGAVLRTGILGRETEFDWTPMFVGSEGTLGIVTRAVLRVHPKPETRAMRGFRFRDVDGGVEAMRRIMQEHLRPSVLRLYDPLDTLLASSHKEPRDAPEAPELAAAEKPQVSSWASTLAGRFARGIATSIRPEEIRRRAASYLEHAQGKALHSALGRAHMVNRAGSVLSKGCKLIVGLEGLRDDVTEDLGRLVALAESLGGVDLGERPGTDWLDHRYDVSFKQMKIYASGAFVDTMEVATTWSRLVDTYDRVRSALSAHVLVMAHFSHAYPEGCSIYFTFAGAAPTPLECAALYDEVWRVGLAAVADAEAVLSHHHGIGLLKRDALAGVVKDGVRLFRAAKHHFDPRGIMNPGKIFADEVEARSVEERT